LDHALVEHDFWRSRVPAPETLRALLRVRAVAATRYHEGQSAIRMRHAEVERGKSTHRQTDDVRLGEA
jgi:hypothetical protein